MQKKAGTRLTFKGEGNHTHPKTPPGDLVFVITEVPHPLFSRTVDNDLVYVHKVSFPPRPVPATPLTI